MIVSVGGQKMENEKPLQKSKYKQIIGEYFDYNLDFEFLDIVAFILDGLDEEEIKNTDDEELYDYAFSMIENSLVYYDDQWKVMKFYQMPSEANLDLALDSLTRDIEKLLEKIKYN